METSTPHDALTQPISIPTRMRRTENAFQKRSMGGSRSTRETSGHHLRLLQQQVESLSPRARPLDERLPGTKSTEKPIARLDGTFILPSVAQRQVRVRRR